MRVGRARDRRRSSWQRLLGSTLGALLLVPTIQVPPSAGHDLPAGDPCEGGPFGVPGLQLPPDQIGEWGPVMSWPNRATHATLLPSGQVLWWRATTAVGFPHLWDPETGAQVPVPGPSADLFCAGHVTVAGGSVLAIGGQPTTGCCFDGTVEANLFRKSANVWSQRAPMGQARWYPTATTLPDGRVLAVSGTSELGGGGGQKVWADVPEIYDPAGDTWTPLPGAELRLPLYPFDFVVPGGGVIAAGPRAETYLLDLETESWSHVATANFDAEIPDGAQSSSAAMFRPGLILKAGGQEPAIAGAEVLDATAGSPAWRVVPEMAFPRRRLDLVLLPDGTVLAVGGSISGQSVPECAVHAVEVWDPQTETWTTLASMQRPRLYHSSALLLADGRVLAAGGENVHEPLGEATAEVFSPPYLFKGPRPVVGSAPDRVGYAERFPVFTGDPAAIASVALLRPGSVTHNFDQNQRYVPLEFDALMNHLQVSAPAGPDLAPPGAYMLFLVDPQGVPSVAHFLGLAPTPASALAPGARAWLTAAMLLVACAALRRRR